MSQLLRIPQPCAESWEAMTPAGAGRHCTACQRVVVDFTQQTDAELLAYLAGAKATPCGRFRPDQLGRPLHPAAPVSRWRGWLAAALALGGMLGAGRAAAQNRSYYAGPLPEAASPATGAATPAPEAAPATVVPMPDTTAGPGGQITVRGVVLDRENQTGLPGVGVLLRGTTVGTSTNAEGHFSLALPSGADAQQLSFQFIGYHAQELALPRNGQPLTVRLAPDREQLLMGVVVLPSRRYRPWHPRALYHRTRGLVSRLLNRE